MTIGSFIVWFGVSAIAFLGGCVVFVNYVTIVRAHLNGQEPSIFPILGGVLLGAAMFISPVETAQQYCWVMGLFDPGCAFWVSKVLYFQVRHGWLRRLFR